MRRTMCSALIFLSLCSVTFAQNENLKTPPGSTAPFITAGSSSERVRFAAPSSVVQMHLQVYTDGGLIVFDATSKGNVLDWTTQDGSGAHLSTGSYLCVVTVKSLNGKLAQRICEVSVDQQRTELRGADPTRLTAAQQREIGPVEKDAAISVLENHEAEAVTTIAHNGEEGQISRGRGALSFRIGDFFSGEDTEQMRLTAEGNLGIGITNPTVKLDVDGLMRASQGIVFPDGSIQYSASRKTFGTVSLMPGESLKKGGQGKDLQPTAVDVSGTGTTGKIVRWLDGPNGVLADSNFTEVSGAVGVNGVPNTSFRLDVNGSTRLRGSNPGFNLEGLAASGNIWLFQTVDNDGRFRLFGQSNIDPGVERLTISLSSGNVGIGATTPAAKLDVAGDIRSSALRQELTASSPNVIGGSLGGSGTTAGNRVTAGVVGATIGGGGFNGTLNFPSGDMFTGDNANRVTDWFGTMGGGFSNRVGNDDATLDNASFATVSGGRDNLASGRGATVGGGEVNLASGAATVGGGRNNAASGSNSTVGGGDSNSASGLNSTVGGGDSNAASGSKSTVGGGDSNSASGVNATVGGGKSNTASGAYSVVPGGLGAKATHHGEMAFASAFFGLPGSAQTSVYTLNGDTTDTTTRELFLDDRTSQRITIATFRALAFDILAVAQAVSGQTAGYTIRGVIKNVSNTVSFVGTPTITVLGEDNASWNVTVEADNTNNALVVKATGAAATLIFWVAAVRTAEVSS